MRAMVWIGVVSATCLFIPQSASAQDSRRLAVTGGYSVVRDNDIDETLIGWVASATGHIASSFGITAEAGGNTKTLPVLGTTLKYRSLSFMAGPHVSVRPSTGSRSLARCSSVVFEVPWGYWIRLTRERTSRFSLEAAPISGSAARSGSGRAQTIAASPRPIRS